MILKIIKVTLPTGSIKPEIRNMALHLIIICVT